MHVVIGGTAFIQKQFGQGAGLQRGSVSFGRVITGTRSQGQGYYGNKGRVITAFPRNFLASPLPLASLELWPFWASFYYFKSPPGETQIFFFGPVTFVSNCQGKMVGYVGLIRANWCLSCFFLPRPLLLTLAIRPSQDAGKLASKIVWEGRIYYLSDSQDKIW